MARAVTTHQSTSGELTRILDERLVVSRYQSIVDLRSGDVAGFEALARGPQGSSLEFPDRLFGEAHAAGRLDELDALCRARAVEGFVDSPLGSGDCTLFVNTEPGVSGHSMVETYETLLRARGNHRIVFEFTERALTDRPADVLGAAQELRRLGAGIALDDVGVDPRSLALLPFVRPDVVKLDMGIVHSARSAHSAKVMHAVGAYAEETGASIVAEGVETPQHLSIARSLGATHGQGWLFSRPDALPDHLDAIAPLPAWTGPPSVDTGTPYERVVRSGRPAQQGDKQLILSLSRQLEVHAATLGEECVVLSNLQHVRHLTDRTAARYSQLADGAAFVGLVGADVGAAPAPGVRGGSYDAADPLTREWTVAVISPHFSAAMLGIDLGDEGVPDLARRFSFCLTYDRELVAQSAAVLMQQITG